MSEAEDREAGSVVDRLREELSGEHSGLGGAMMGIADSYMELAYGAGRGYGVHAEYRASNLNTGKPVAELAAELATWAAEIAEKAVALDAKRARFIKLKREQGDDSQGPW
ncbi:hypothetical protein ACFXOL_31840 [Streptomyces californicus]|uniref:hypothetical protein n=1 Tax=Streptomyces californicus TaxID=67351 RepID=UPI00365DB041